MAKIIIVEDDPMISEIYERKFSEAGFQTLVAAAGDQVLEMARYQNPDLILLDLMIPRMDGFEVIKNIKDGTYPSNIKIIVSSNLSEREDREKAMKLGADGFVTKADYTPSELVKEIQRMMDVFVEEKKNEARRSGLSKNNSGENPKKILLIEDEEVFVDMFGMKLKQDGFEVDFAKTGPEGLEKAKNGNYDLLIIDMILPEMNGDEIIAKLKMEENTKNIPMIPFSASLSGEDEILDRVKEYGIKDVCLKTQLIPSQLSKKVSEILGISEN